MRSLIGYLWVFTCEISMSKYCFFTVFFNSKSKSLCLTKNSTEFILTFYLDNRSPPPMKSTGFIECQPSLSHSQMIPKAGQEVFQSNSLGKQPIKEFVFRFSFILTAIFIISFESQHLTLNNFRLDFEDSYIVHSRF